ncbi:MAG: DsrE family protein [Spirochaetales bacterium]|nr:DsrE family protein [Spirochaetales bacterium]
MKDDTLIVLWTSGDREVALNMVLMYTKNAKGKGWWKNVTLVIWGPSAKLAVQDKEITSILKEMAEGGIRLEACKACSDRYGVSEELEEMSVEVKYMGQPLTSYLKDGYTVITL